MIALDATFLLDYLDGDEGTARFLRQHEAKPFFAPTLALFEVYRGAARVGNSEALERVQRGLEWLEPLPLSAAAASEAAAVDAELRRDDTPINLGDVLIAGICRVNGADLVTRDDDFEAVEDLDVRDY